MRGLALTRDDLLRRAVIMALMCQGRVEFESIELAHLIDMREHFAAELEQLQPLAETGLVEIEPTPIQVTAARLVLRARAWRWCSTATCRPTGRASASRASSERRHELPRSSSASC